MGPAETNMGMNIGRGDGVWTTNHLHRTFGRSGRQGIRAIRVPLPQSRLRMSGCVLVAALAFALSPSAGGALEEGRATPVSAVEFYTAGKVDREASVPGGEGAQNEAGTVRNGDPLGPAGNQPPVHIAFVIMSTTSPHALINQKHDIFRDQLATIGRGVKYTGTRSLNNLFPLLDKKNGSPDFAYVPHSAFATYITRTSKYGGGDKYAIVAGSLDLSDIDLVTKPEIRSLNELSGRRIAISNLRHTDEFHLNQLLESVGLNTKLMGGDVEIVWDDIVQNTLENYEKGLYDGIIVFNTDNRDLAVSKVPGSRVHKLHPEGLYGGQHPRVWMVAKKYLIINNPELVKTVLRAHVLLDDKANEEKNELSLINMDIFVSYFNKLGADISSRHPLKKFQERWQMARITYDPNMDFIKKLYSFLEFKGVAKALTIDDFVRIAPLNETLRAMGRHEVNSRP